MQLILFPEPRKANYCSRAVWCMRNNRGEGRIVTPDVFVVHTEPHYPAFPVTETNGDGILRGLRNLFSLWGKNPDNPFEKLVGPGGRVVIKPNWVHNYNPSGH